MQDHESIMKTTETTSELTQLQDYYVSIYFTFIYILMSKLCQMSHKPLYPIVNSIPALISNVQTKNLNFFCDIFQKYKQRVSKFVLILELFKF